MSRLSRSKDLGALNRYAENGPTDLVDLASPFHSEASANVLFGASRLGRGHRGNIPVLVNARAVLSARTAFPRQSSRLEAAGSVAAIVSAVGRKRRTLATLIAFLFALALAGTCIEGRGGPNLSFDHTGAPHGPQQI
jgi:hypothetical protein